MKNLKVIERYVSMLLSAPKEEEELETYREIAEGVVFRGYNLWILGFAMILACIGLITNSITAVIGAMLMSPLMGPVAGFAFAVAINDRDLKIKSIKNWLLMTAVSLLAATLFFVISPFHKTTDLLEVYDRASIFDIMVAFFGGMAGFIGVMKKEGTKIIASVAIATACMPPLCTAAYGIANGEIYHFLGGFYFYLINSMFIGWATFLLARYFKFTSVRQERKNRYYQIAWDILIVLIMLPGIYIAYQKWNAQERKQQPPTDQQRIELLEKKINDLEKKLDKY